MTTKVYELLVIKFKIGPYWLHWSDYEQKNNGLDSIFLTKKCHTSSDTHVGSYVQINEELLWSFCTCLQQC